MKLHKNSLDQALSGKASTAGKSSCSGEWGAWKNGHILRSNLETSVMSDNEERVEEKPEQKEKKILGKKFPERWYFIH